MADYDLGTAHGKITLDYNGEKAASQAEKDIDKLKRKSETSDKSLGRLGSTLKGLGKGLSLAGLVTSLSIGAVQAAAMATQLLGMIPALVSITSLSALLPAAYIGMAAAIGVVKASLAGVGDAVSAAFDDSTAGATKFNKALEALSPNARAFAVAFRKAAPALKAVQQGIQDAFFSNNLQALLPRLVSGLNSLRPTLNGLASDFGRVGKGVVGFIVDSDRSWEFLDNVITEVRRTIISLEPTIRPILAGIRAVGEIGLTFFPRLRGVIVGVAQAFGAWLAQITSNGDLERWINTAIATLKTLGGIVSNVFSILNSVISAASASGGGLLNTILLLTDQLRAFLGTTEGAAALSGFFSSLMALAGQLAPVVTTLAGALLTALGPALLQIAQQVGPVLLQVIQALAPAFGPLATAIADLLTAVAPLIPPLATLVGLLVGDLATAITSVSVALGPVIKQFSGAFTSALTTLAPLFSSLAEEIFPLAEALGPQLVAAITPLIPVIAQLAEAFARELAPSIPELAAAAAQLIPSIVQLAQAVTNLLLVGLQAILPIMPQIVDLLTLLTGGSLPATKAIIDMAAALTNFAALSLGNFFGLLSSLASLPGIIGGAFSAAWDVITGVGSDILGWFTNLPSLVGGALSSLGTTVGSAFASIGTFFASVGTAIGNFITSIPGRIAALPGQILTILGDLVNGWVTALGFGAGLVVGIFTKLPQRIADALVNLAQLLGQKAQEAWAAVQSFFTTGVNNSVATAQGLGARVVAAIKALPGQVATIASNAWNAVRTAFSNGVANAVAFARNLLVRVRSALSALPGQLSRLASDAWNRFRNGVASGTSAVISYVGGIPRRVVGALGNLGSLLLDSGRRVIDGLVSGIQGGISRVMDTVRGLADRVKGAFNSALEIFSPSRAFRWSGEMVGEGLIVGLGRKLAQVRAMAQTLANSVIAPTANLPAAIAPVSQNAAYNNPYRSATDSQTGSRREFGPYHVDLDGKAVASFVIDTITGNPKVVKKSADEGSRQAAFA